MASNRKALCVGINQFKNYSSSNLQGCVNDAHDMGALLKDFLGFTAGDITTLTDAQATKANIMSNLKSMVADAKAGKYSYLVFSLSSHGTQVPDTSGDEPDRADEAFCPHDLAQKGNVWTQATSSSMTNCTTSSSSYPRMCCWRFISTPATAGRD